MGRPTDIHVLSVSLRTTGVAAPRRAHLTNPQLDPAFALTVSAFYVTTWNRIRTRRIRRTDYSEATISDRFCRTTGILVPLRRADLPLPAGSASGFRSPVVIAQGYPLNQTALQLLISIELVRARYTFERTSHSIESSHSSKKYLGNHVTHARYSKRPNTVPLRPRISSGECITK